MLDRLRRDPRLLTAVVAGGSVVLLAVAIGLAFAVFRGALMTGDASAAPSASALTSSSPTAEASPSSTPASPSASAIPYAASDPLLVVRVNGLRMRVSSSTSADIVKTLGQGDVVRLRGGAQVEADGYAWHEVIDLDSQIGWVAMGSGATGPWLESIAAHPARSPMLLRLERDCDVALREFAPIVVPADVTLTADGRVVLITGDVRQLSASGLAQVQRDALQLPALQASATYRLEPNPAAPDAPGHGLCVNHFTVGEGAGQVEVNSVGWQGQEEGVYWLPAPERQALDQLATHLLDVEAWLGPSAWSGPADRYVSNSYQLRLDSPTDAPPDPSLTAPLVTGTAWPFDGPIEQFGEPVGESRCGHLDLAQAFETVRLMRSLGVDIAEAWVDTQRELGLDGFGLGYFRTDAGWFSFWLTPRSPDGYPGCADQGWTWPG